MLLVLRIRDLSPLEPSSLWLVAQASETLEGTKP